MLVVKTFLKETTNKGIGLFAGEFIPKGKIIWVLEPFFIVDFKNELINTFPELVKEFLEKYTWTKDGETYHLAIDNERFVNHSETPNVGENKVDESMVALRDIQEGEEILYNYRDFDLTSENDLGFVVK